MALFTVGCGGGQKAENSQPQESVLQFETAKVEMLVGETAQLSILNLEEDETVLYTSNDERVASVTDSGLVEGKNVGSAVVKATTNQGRTTSSPGIFVSL